MGYKVNTKNLLTTVIYEQVFCMLEPNVHRFSHKLCPDQIARSGGDTSSGGTMRSPKIRMIWDWRIPGIEPLRRSIEQAEPFASHTCNDLRSYTSPWPGFPDT